MKIQKALALSIALSLVPTVALAWRASNRHEVLPVSPGVFEVVSEVGSAPIDYWCGIGEFALAELRAGATDRIYITRGLGPSANRPGRKAVQFSLTEPTDADTSSRLFVTIRHVGENLTASFARNYCFDRLPGQDVWDIF